MSVLKTVAYLMRVAGVRSSRPLPNFMGRPICKTSYRQLALEQGCSKSTIGYRLGKEMKFVGSCQQCGQVLSSKREIRFCNPKCHADYVYEKYIAEWKAGNCTGGSCTGDVSGHVRRFLFLKYENRCSKCGWDELNLSTGLIPLEVNHVDGNCSNHIEDNLELICPNCHSLTPTFRSLNKGSKRKGD